MSVHDKYVQKAKSMWKGSVGHCFVCPPNRNGNNKQIYVSDSDSWLAAYNDTIRYGGGYNWYRGNCGCWHSGGTREPGVKRAPIRSVRIPVWKELIRSFFIKTLDQLNAWRRFSKPITA